jgi:methionine synthase I (cobalamin-dependent)
MAKPLAELRALCGEKFPLMAYGNIGYVDEEQGWINTNSIDPAGYLHHAKSWPVQIIGGCCGTTPEHIRKLKQDLVH